MLEKHRHPSRSQRVYAPPHPLFQQADYAPDPASVCRLTGTWHVQSQQPTFRSTTDQIAVDVRVVDEAGRSDGFPAAQPGAAYGAFVMTASACRRALMSPAHDREVAA